MVQYSQSITGVPGIALHLYQNPFQFRETVERETLASGGSGNGKRPHRDQRDFWVFVGAVIGIIVGCTAGAIIGGSIAGLGGIFLGIVAGMFVGGLGGSWVGEQIKKKKYARKKVNRKETAPGKGPFIG